MVRVGVKTENVGLEHYATTVTTEGGDMFFRYSEMDVILLRSVLEKEKGEWGVAIPVNAPAKQFVSLFNDGGELSMFVATPMVIELGHEDALIVARSIVGAYEKSRERGELRSV